MLNEALDSSGVVKSADVHFSSDCLEPCAERAGGLALFAQDRLELKSESVDRQVVDLLALSDSCSFGRDVVIFDRDVRLFQRYLLSGYRRI